MPKSAKHVHHRVTWEPVTQGSEIIRSSIGGYPVLPTGHSIPVCSESDCGKPMSLFLQLAVEERFGLPFEAGSVLSVFQCIEHDDPFEELDTKFPKKRGDLLPDYYWNHTNYALFFAAPDRAQQLPECEPWVHYSRLVIEPEPEPPSKSVAALNYSHIKIGGSPFWVQNPKIWSCSCGAPMTFVCSLPENLQYPRVEGSPKQPNGRAGTFFCFSGFSHIFSLARRAATRAGSSRYGKTASGSRLLVWLTAAYGAGGPPVDGDYDNYDESRGGGFGDERRQVAGDTEVPRAAGGALLCKPNATLTELLDHCRPQLPDFLGIIDNPPAPGSASRSDRHRCTGHWRRRARTVSAPRKQPQTRA